MSPASRRLQLRQRHRRRSHRAADVVRPCASRRELSVVRTRADTAPKVGAPLRLAQGDSSGRRGYLPVSPIPSDPVVQVAVSPRARSSSAVPSLELAYGGRNRGSCCARPPRCRPGRPRERAAGASEASSTSVPGCLEYHSALVPACSKPAEARLLSCRMRSGSRLSEKRPASRGATVTPNPTSPGSSIHAPIRKVRSVYVAGTLMPN